MEKVSILSISHKQSKGLILGWNFQDLLSNERYFRHFTVIYGNDLQRARELYNSYNKRLKIGDLYSYMYCNQFQEVKIKSWQEKILIKNDKKKYKPFKDNVKANRREDLFEMLLHFQRQEKLPPIINIYVETLQDYKWFRGQITSMRRQGSFNYFVSFLGPFPETSFSINEGFNLISTKSDDWVESLNFLIKQINQAVFQYVKVSIESENGQLVCQNEKFWNNIDFNRIERQFYGPTSSYKSDILNIFNISSAQEYRLIINLVFKHFDGKQYKSRKVLLLNLNLQKGPQRTYVESHPKPFPIATNTSLTESPFQTNSCVMLKNNPSSKRQSDI